MKIHQFTAAVGVIIEDDHALERASKRDLVLLEGVLTALRDRVTAELDARGSNPLTIVRRTPHGGKWMAMRGSWWGFGQTRAEAIAKMAIEARR